MIRNPCHLVRTSCAEFYQRSQQEPVPHDGQELGDDEPQPQHPSSLLPYVTINKSAIKTIAKQMIEQEQQKPYSIEWDEENWHYNVVKDIPSENGNTMIHQWSDGVRFERTAASILAIDAINFCFWTKNNDSCNDRFEYEHLAMAMNRMGHSDHAIQNQTLNIVSQESFLFSASNLAKITCHEMTQLFETYSTCDCTTTTTETKKLIPPYMEDRVQMWNHIGTVLLDQFNGQVTNLIQLAKGSAIELVQLLIEYFPKCFGGDCVTIPDNNNQIHFYKRAQIFVGDINSALKLNLSDMDQLTMFADYRVPQILHHLNVLQYSDALCHCIDTYTVFDIGSMEEISIRCATVTAVEWLVDELNNCTRQESNNNDDSNNDHKTNDKKWTPIVTDWYLWQLGERMMNENKLKPHHRVRTIYY